MPASDRRRTSETRGRFGRISQFEIKEVHIKYLYIVLMGILLFDFLCRMAFSYNTRPVMICRSAAAMLGIWIGKTWKDKGFRLMTCYLVWMTIRCLVSLHGDQNRTQAMDRILSLFWAVGGCYSLGRVLTEKEIRRFLKIVCLVWTGGMVISSCLGIAAAWMRIRIPNFSNTGSWRIWGDTSSARLNMLFNATVSGSILSISILISLLAFIQSDKKSKRIFFLAAILPMTVALCLTDSRTAQVTLAAGAGSILFSLLHMHFRSKGFLKNRTVTGHFPVSPAQMAASAAAALTAAALMFLILINLNPLFDIIKIAGSKRGILPTAAVTEETTVLMSHRGLEGGDILTGRDQIWRAVLSYLGGHPHYLLYGASIINPMSRITDQNSLTFVSDHCHNIILQILVEGGVISLMLISGFILFLGRKSLKNYHRKNQPVWLIMLPCLLLSMFVGDMAECLTWTVAYKNSPVPFILFLLAGIIAASDKENESLPQNKKLRSCLVFPAVFIAVICSLAMFLHHYSYQTVHQDDYDDPVRDLYYECGDSQCEIHHGNHTIKSSGCALCAISNAVQYMTGMKIDVHDLAVFARENKQFVVHVGSASTVSEESAKLFGKEYGYCYIGQVPDLKTATAYLEKGCTIIAGTGNSTGGAHVVVIADYNPFTKNYLILDSAGNYEGWSRHFSSWQQIAENRLQSNPDVFLTSFRILGPERMHKQQDTSS